MPGCTVLVVRAVKTGMTPLQLEQVGVMWGRLNRRFWFIRFPWGRQALSELSLYPAPREAILRTGVEPSEGMVDWTPPPISHGFLDRFRQNLVQIVSLDGPDRPTLHFHGEVYREEIPMEHLAPVRPRIRATGRDRGGDGQRPLLLRAPGGRGVGRSPRHCRVCTGDPVRFRADCNRGAA